jgi:aminoglycoside 6'-N-acetyltransferase I
VGYLEGIFVDEACRTSGVGRALVEAAEDVARLQGCTEMASDRELDNEASGLFHQAVGYQEVERIVCFRKPL